MDGIQRMSAINGYIENEFPLRKLEYLVSSRANGTKTCPRAMQRRIRETELVG